MTATLMLLGHSHLKCVDEALKANILPNAKWRYLHLTGLDKRLSQSSGSRNPHRVQALIAREIVREVGRLGGSPRELKPLQVPHYVKQHDILAVLCMRGDHHIEHGILRRDPLYDFVLPEYESLPFEKGAHIVPYNAVYAHYEELLKPTLDQIVQVHALFQNNVYHLEVPPPYGDSAYISEKLHRYLAKHRPDGFEIASPLLRFKLWRLGSDIYRRKCESLGIKYVAVPPNVLVEEQFMHPNGYYDDGFHGNRWYGEQVIQNLMLTVKAEAAAGIRGE